jgi:hypothetical protein
VRFEKPAQSSLEQDEDNSFVYTVSTVLSLVPVINWMVRSSLHLVGCERTVVQRSNRDTLCAAHKFCHVGRVAGQQRSGCGYAALWA